MDHETQFQMEVDDANIDDDDMGQEVCIDNPARRLYVIEQKDERPFQCPVLGCTKTYKNQNGLKYHRLHGHQNQTLRENSDGTLSVINPDSDSLILMEWPLKRTSLIDVKFVANATRISTA